MTRYEELDDQFEKLPEKEQDFVIYLAISKLLHKYEIEEVIAEKKENLGYKFYLEDVQKTLKRVKETLAYKVF